MADYEKEDSKGQAEYLSRKAEQELSPTFSDEESNDIASISGRSKKTDGDIDVARAMENLEASKADISILRCATAEAKLDRLASWADSAGAHLFEPPCDFSELPRRLQAALHWMLKHLRAHREGISFLAHAVKPWQQVVSVGRKAMAGHAVEEQSSHFSGKEPLSPSFSSGCLMRGKEADDNEIGLAEDTCNDIGRETDALPPSAELIAFDVVALSWMVKTEGNLGQKGKQLEEIEETIKVLRMRLDKVVTEFSRHFKTAGRVSRNNLELLSDSQVAKRQFQDKEQEEEQQASVTSATVQSKLGRLFSHRGSFTGAAFSIAEDSSVEDQVQSETDSFDAAPTSTHSDSRRASVRDVGSLFKGGKRQSQAPSPLGFSTVTPPPLTAVTRGEFTEVQQSVCGLEGSHQALVAEVNKLLLAQERRMDEVEKAASAHFKQLKDFIEIATNTANEGMEATKRASALAAASMQAAADRSEALLIHARQVEDTVQAVDGTPSINPRDSSVSGGDGGLETQASWSVTKNSDDGTGSRPGSARSTRSRPGSARSPRSNAAKGPRIRESSLESILDERRSRNKSRIASDATAFGALSSLQDRMQTMETSVNGLVSDVASLRQQVQATRRMSFKCESTTASTCDSEKLVRKASSPEQQQQQQQQQKQPVQHELPPARLRTVICGDVFDVPSPQCPPMKDLSKALTLRGKLNAKRRPATPLSIPAGGPPPARPGTPSSPHTMSFRKSGTRRSSSQSSALMMRSSSPDSQHEVDLTLAIGVGAPSGQVSES